jgi:hypothetical protein
MEVAALILPQCFIKPKFMYFVAEGPSYWSMKGRAPELRLESNNFVNKGKHKAV